ncbi:MAG: phage holin family protein [Gemmatimonadaceae bacterium]
MTVAVHVNGRRPVGSLLRDLAEGGVGLVRNEIRLARIETVEALNAIGRGAALVATAAVLALLGGLAFLAGLILLIGDQWLPRDLYWLAALLVVVITGGLAAWLAKRGLSLLSPAELAPEETVSTIRETKEELVAAVRR